MAWIILLVPFLYCVVMVVMTIFHKRYQIKEDEKRYTKMLEEYLEYKARKLSNPDSLEPPKIHPDCIYGWSHKGECF